MKELHFHSNFHSMRVAIEKGVHLRRQSLVCGLWPGNGQRWNMHALCGAPGAYTTVTTARSCAEWVAICCGRLVASMGEMRVRRDNPLHIGTKTYVQYIYVGEKCIIRKWYYNNIMEGQSHLPKADRIVVARLHQCAPLFKWHITPFTSHIYTCALFPCLSSHTLDVFLLCTFSTRALCRRERLSK